MLLIFAKGLYDCFITYYMIECSKQNLLKIGWTAELNSVAKPLTLRGKLIPFYVSTNILEYRY